MSTRFNVIYCGELRSGVSAQQAIIDFSARFKMPEEQARRLVLGNRERVLKRNVGADKAETIRAAIEATGLVARIEPIAEPPLLDLEPLPDDLDGHEEAASNPAGAPGTGVALAKSTTEPQGHPTDSGQGRAETRGIKQNGPASPQPTGGPPIEPQSRPFEAGWHWIARGFWHFKTDPWPWIGSIVILYVILIAVSLVPFAGAIASTILGPMFTGGLMLGAQAQERGEGLRVEHLFAGFGERAGQLALVGVIYLAGGLLIALVIFILVGGSLAMTAFSVDPVTFEQGDVDQMLPLFGPAILLPMLLALLLLVPLAMALFFAPPLVVLANLDAITAMRQSFIGCLRNILPFLLYGLIAGLMVLAGAIPFMLGLLVVLPILMASLYAAYRDIYRQVP